MEDDSKISLIKKRIDEAPFGSAFVTSDFTDLAEYETAKKTISRLVPFFRNMLLLFLIRLHMPLPGTIIGLFPQAETQL